MSKTRLVGGGLMLLAVPLLILGTASFSLLTPKVYESSASIAADPDPSEVTRCWGLPYKSNVDLEFIHQKMNELRSDIFLSTVVEKERLQEKWGQSSPDTTLEMLTRNLRIERGGVTPLIWISVKSHEPKEASDLANSIAELFRKYCLGLLTAAEREKIKTIDEELKKQLRIYEDQENEVITQREQLGIDLNSTHVPDGKEFDELRIAQARLIDERTKYNQLKAEHRREIIQLKVPRSPIRIIDRAEPNYTPVAPNLSKYILSVICCSIVLGIAGLVLVRTGFKSSRCL
jgi:uncharacterized protein involved in exopolysaccharide biosynthesis